MTLDSSLSIEALKQNLQSTMGLPVETRETPISWVLLCGALAYKIKKPVRLAYLDFSTLERRLHFCQEELRLNRRLAPALYLDVVPVKGTLAAPRLDGEGEPIDYAVRMRRLAPGALLSEQLMSGQLRTDSLDALGSHLAKAHGLAPVAPSDSSYGRPALMVEALRSVLACIDMDDPLAQAALHAWAERQASVMCDAWERRRVAGAVRECHGDLHLSNLALVDAEFVAFDCLEFDPALRWIDVMNDLAFLTMDLKAHGHEALAWRLLDRYLQDSGDYGGLEVLRFYEIYRALVRALVTQLQAGPVAHQGENRHLDWAMAALRQPACEPRLLIMHGLSGSGKSTLAAQLVESCGAIRIRSDVERRRLFGAGGQAVPHDAGSNRKTYEHLHEVARNVLLSGWPLIIDATFLKRRDRHLFGMLAAELDVPFRILDCLAGETELRWRIDHRRAWPRELSDTQVDVGVLKLQQQSQEALSPQERRWTLSVRTDRSLDVNAIRRWWLG